ncbi:unnamed protein product, partial [Ectocarpus sp. 12 AP-2014]
ARVWFSQLVEVERRDDMVELAAPTRFVAEYVRTHLTARLLGAWRDIDPSIRSVKISVAG